MLRYASLSKSFANAQSTQKLYGQKVTHCSSVFLLYISSCSVFQPIFMGYTLRVELENNSTDNNNHNHTHFLL